MIVVVNAFSINMLGPVTPGRRRVIEFHPFESAAAARQYIRDREVVSAIGHADTAAAVSAQLGVHLPVSRIDVRLSDCDSIIVAQYTGPRLAERAASLPPDAQMTYWLVRGHYADCFLDDDAYLAREREGGGFR